MYDDFRAGKGIFAGERHSKNEAVEMWNRRCEQQFDSLADEPFPDKVQYVFQELLITHGSPNLCSARRLCKADGWAECHLFRYCLERGVLFLRKACGA